MLGKACNASHAVLHKQLGCYRSHVGLNPAWACPQPSVPFGGDDSSTDKCPLRNLAQQLQVTVLQLQVPQKFEVFKLCQAAWKNLYQSKACCCHKGASPFDLERLCEVKLTFYWFLLGFENSTCSNVCC